MQLFPSDENDFFRNRLTHSLEVAQIASGIALDLNRNNRFFQQNPVDVDLVQFAGLAHDLGHPPFGHNGEKALDRLMLRFGGFEANAQTLRILARLEKNTTRDNSIHPLIAGTDNRLGLNLTYRALASILKYDREIPRVAEGETRDKPVKGHYYCEADLVKEIKNDVVGEEIPAFKTIECSIMDVADDIAYSTYDLERLIKSWIYLSPYDAFLR